MAGGGVGIKLFIFNILLMCYVLFVLQSCRVAGGILRDWGHLSRQNKSKPLPLGNFCFVGGGGPQGEKINNINQYITVYDG